MDHECYGTIVYGEIKAKALNAAVRAAQSSSSEMLYNQQHDCCMQCNYFSYRCSESVWSCIPL